MVGAHLRPIRIELFGDECRQTRERPLPELDVLGEHRDGVIGADADEGVRREGGRAAWLEPVSYTHRGVQHGSALQRVRGIFDRSADADIGGATADVAVHGEIDIAITRLGVDLQQRHRAHDLSGLAVSALRNIVTDPGLLHRFGLAPGHTFDGGDLVAADTRDRHRTGADRTAVEINRAGPALRNAAAIFGAGQPDAFADRP